MKKILFFASALAGLLLAGSCQREELAPATEGSVVTFEVSVPEIATKALGDDVSNINDLVYAVYWTEAESLEELQDSPSLQGSLNLLYKKNYTVNPFNGTGRATVNVELLNDKNYIVLFWAQKDNVWVPEGNDFNDFDLRSVSYPENMQANSNDYAAFSGVSFISKNNLSGKKDVTLKRPFAQLNIGTTLPNDKTGEEHNFDVAISKTSVQVKNAGTSFNLIKQVAEGNATVDAPVTFAEAAAPINPDHAEGKLVVNNMPYTYVAMNYVFANGNVEVDYVINLGNYHGTVTNTVSNVPVAANYRTNIIGNLLTGTTEYNVVLDDFDTNDNSGDIEVITEGLVKNINGDYEISTDNGLIHAINNLWVDENGVANPKTFYVYPQEYNITDDQIRDVVVTSGTLKVIKDKPVMTRSIGIDGIVIKGLSKPLIASVGEDATVVISGVTIQNYEGDNQKGALVGENDGKVIIEDCAVVDETGADDDTKELIGDEDDNGTVAEPEYDIEGNSAVVYDAVQLTAAFADAEVDAIVLGADITLEDVLVFPDGRPATLDLKGYKLTTALLIVNGDLTVKDSYGVGEIKAGSTSALQVNHGGKLTVNCNITAHESVVRSIGGEVIINGGKYVQTGTYYSELSTLRYAIDCRPDEEGNVGEITIIDGEFTSNNGIFNAGGVLTINGGKFINIIDKGMTRHMMYVNGSAEVNINGGEFHGEANGSAGGTHICVYTSKASVNITDGKFTSLWYNGGANTIIEEYSAGSQINVVGGEFNTTRGLTKYINKDYKAVQNEETNYWDVVAKVYVAEVVGGEKYETLQEAVNAAQDGATIELLSNETFSETNRYNNGGWWDGLGYSGDKSFTIDLKGKTITQNGALNDYLMWFKNDGDKPNTITLKNGTMDAGTTAYCALATSSSNAQKITINLENINLINNNSNGATIKLRAGAELNVKAGTVITAKNSYAGMEIVGNETVTNIYEGAKIYQNGTSSSWGFLVGASWGATVNVYGGEGVSARGGFMAMTSGGTINISGGQWTANVDGTIGNNSNVYVLTAQNNKYENGYTGASIINVTDGTFRGGMDAWILNQGLGEVAELNIKGGNFNANPSSYVENGYRAAEDNGIWNVTDAQVYTEAALKAALKAGGEIILGSDITLTEDWTPIGNAENPFNGIINGNNHKISGLKVSGVDYAAFISHAGKDVVVKNLTLENVDLNSTKHAAGVVCVASEEGVTLENVTVSGTIVAASYAGGLLHNAANAVIKNCVNNADISANRAGGIASWVTVNATIENVQNYGNITGAVGASGIAHGFAGSIKNAVNYGAVTSNNVEAAAGIAGVQKAASTYEYCYNYGVITSTYDNPNSSAAGILGQSAGSASTLKYCANYGTVSAEQSYAAGIAYSLYGTINASYCYNAGTVSGADGAGAIAPKAQYGTTDKASYCLNAGKITSSNGTVYQGSNQNVSSYYYDGTTLKNVADNSEVAEADALAILNGGSDNDFFSTENGKITVK